MWAPASWNKGSGGSGAASLVGHVHLPGCHLHYAWSHLALPPFPLSNRPKRFPFTEGGGCGRRSWVHGLPLPILVVLAIFLLLDTLVSLGERASSPQIWSLRDVGVELV